MRKRLRKLEIDDGFKADTEDLDPDDSEDEELDMDDAENAQAPAIQSVGGGELHNQI